LNRLLEPIYGPIRRILPNTQPLDLSPLVAFIILISLRDYILPELFGLQVELSKKLIKLSTISM
jgi:YggT family protein